MGENLKIDISGFNCWYNSKSELLSGCNPNYANRTVTFDTKYYQLFIAELNNLLATNMTDENRINLNKFMTLFKWESNRAPSCSKGERYKLNEYSVYTDSFNEMELSGCMTYHHEKGSDRNYLQIYDFTSKFWELLRYVSVVSENELYKISECTYSEDVNCEQTNLDSYRLLFSKTWLHSYGNVKNKSLCKLSDLNPAFDMDLNMYLRLHKSNSLVVHEEPSTDMCRRLRSDGYDMDIITRSRIISTAQYFLEKIYSFFIDDIYKTTAKITSLGNGRLILLTSNIDLPSFDLYKSNEYITTISPKKLNLNNFEQLKFIMDGGW